MSKPNLKKILSLIRSELVLGKETLAPSLMAGELSIILFLTESDSYKRIQDDSIEQRLETAFQDFQSNNDLSFAHGLSGLGWFLQHLNNKGLIETESVENLLDQVDEIAYNSAIFQLDKNNHDFLHGGLGSATYLATRINAASKPVSYILDIVSKLTNNSFSSAKHIYWKDNEPNIFYELAEESVTLGLAHGQASKIVFFSKLVVAKIEVEKSKSILIKSVKFLRSCRFSTQEVSVFPLYCVDGKPRGVSRLAWCHGDLGIGMALYEAGIALQDEELMNEAIDICTVTTKRKTIENTDIVDAGLCHGIAGVLTMYNIMYENTGLKVFFAAAEYWLDELFKKVDNKGLAGLDAWDNVNKKWVKDDGLLNGLAGIGLALLSHKSRDFEWSSCLLMK